jgi:transcriptional regulator with GAF, ATPase, and Fis domain
MPGAGAKRDFHSRATVHLCGTLDIEKSLNRFLLFAKSYLPIDQITLNTFDAQKHLIRVVAGATAATGNKLDIITPLSTRAVNELKGSALPKVRRVNTPEQDRVTVEMARNMGKPDSSFVIMRLELDGERLGTVVIRCDGRNRYTAEHEELISALNEPFAIALANYLRHEEVLRLTEILADDNRFLHQEMKRLSGETIIGHNQGLKHLMELVGQVAPLDSPVLLLGETGTGKELIANAIHDASRRCNGPLVKVNCAALTDSLLDSELFGHEKGAFTGADRQKRGRFERAHKGTLFLDEIGELKPDAQAKLLRVLQNHEIERVGGTQTIPVDIRIIAATHRNLEQMILSGRFREDLWYRLNLFPIMIPPLRARTDDIPVLVDHFLRTKSMALGMAGAPALSPGAIQHLCSYHWPGNVRELENVIERALITQRHGPLTFIELNQRNKPPAGAPTVDTRGQRVDSFDQAVYAHLVRVLEMTRGRIEGEKGAAKLLQLNPSTLRNKMRRLGIICPPKKRSAAPQT